MAKWKLTIDDISSGGFAPAWYKETYPSFGNRNHAGAMTDMDLTNPGYIQQGAGLSNLTNGTDAGVVTTLIKGILDRSVTSDATYAIGGALLHKISSSTVTSGGSPSWPRTIDKGAVTGEDGEDVVEYKGALYYTYNHSGSAGDIGKYDLASTFDDDWGSTTPTGAAALTDNPHPLIVGGNDVMYFGNGIYVGNYDNTTLDTQALDLPTGSVIQDIAWNADRLWILANNPDVAGSNKNSCSVYVWDGTSTSWELEIKLMGKGGAFHVKNGVLFVFYADLSSTGGFKLGFVSGAGVKDLANFTGALPAFYQVTDYKDFVLWVSSDKIFAYGSGDTQLPVRLFQLADGGHATVGGLAAPFGTPMVASFDGATAYRLAQFSGFTTTAAWKSLMFDVTNEDKTSHINEIRFNFEKLASNARVDWSLVNNQGTTIYSDVISHTKLGAVTSERYRLRGLAAENFRVELTYANGDTTNTVAVKNIKIYGDSS